METTQSGIELSSIPIVRRDGLAWLQVGLSLGRFASQSRFEARIACP